jgi:DsbC/DsbD-like thiol-disulfide interchange protein
MKVRAISKLLLLVLDQWCFECHDGNIRLGSNAYSCTMKNNRFPLFLISCLCWLAPIAWAESPLTIRLVSEVKSITPGQPFYVGLALHHAPGYHTYWKNGGIVGVPTEIKWKGLPSGFKAGGIEWPEPELTKMFTVVCQGFERDVVLPIRITPSSKLNPGSTVRLTGKATWMCCNRVCNPGFADLSIELPVKASLSPDFDPNWRTRFEQERARPILESAAWQSSASATNNEVTLILKPEKAAATLKPSDAAGIRFFTEDSSIDSDKPQQVEVLQDGSLRLSLIAADYLSGKLPRRLNGVLVRKKGWLEDGTLRALRVSPLLEKK